MPNSRCVLTENKAIWKENLAIYQKSLGAFFQATLFELSPSLLVGDTSNTGLIEGDRYAPQNIFLMFLLVLFFSLDHAQTTISIETFLLYHMMVKQIKIVHGCGNIIIN